MLQRTSIKAAINFEPKRNSITHKVYNYVVSTGLVGATDQELEKILRMEGNTIRPARGKLVKNYLISDSGRTRRNDKNNECIVWIATEEGMLL